MRQNLRILTCALVFITGATLVYSRAALAQQKSLNVLVSDYLDLAFSSENAQLTKPASTRDIAIKVFCAASEGCSSAMQAIRNAMIVPKLVVNEITQFNPKDLNSVVLYSDLAHDDRNLAEYATPNLLPGQQIYEDGNAACNARVFHTAHAVDSVAIYVDQKMESKKIVSCILLELARATGLNVGPRFQKQWEPDGPLFTASKEQFDQAMVGLQRVLAIHFNSILSPGMSKSQTSAALNDLTVNELTGE